MNPAVKILIRVVIIIIAVLLIALIIFSLHMAKTLSFPKGLSLEEEKQWNITNGVWGKLEKYDCEEYTVEGKDGYILHCEVLCNDETKAGNKYVIISHGYNSNRNGAGKYVPIYIELGYNCVIYDLRGHGENEQPTVNTIGNYESQDLVKIIEDAYDRFGDDIYLGLHGESMGSSTSLSALAYDPDVRFVVADCGFANLYELIGCQLDAYHLRFTEPVIDTAIRLRYGWSMKDTHAIDALPDTKVPICFIHGAADTFITPDNSKRMSEAAGGYSELHLVDYAEHAKSREVLGKKAYGEIVSAFLDKVSEQEKE